MNDLVRLKERDAAGILQDLFQRRLLCIIYRYLIQCHMDLLCDLSHFLAHRRALFSIQNIVHTHHLLPIITKSPRAVVTYFSSFVVRMRIAPFSAVVSQGIPSCSSDARTEGDG